MLATKHFICLFHRRCDPGDEITLGDIEEVEVTSGDLPQLRLPTLLDTLWRRDLPTVNR
jgi:hypothetical protein